MQRVDFKNELSRNRRTQFKTSMSFAKSDRKKYDLGLGINKPIKDSNDTNIFSSPNGTIIENLNVGETIEDLDVVEIASKNWIVHPTITAPNASQSLNNNTQKISESELSKNFEKIGKYYSFGAGRNKAVPQLTRKQLNDSPLAKAVWDKDHYLRDDSTMNKDGNQISSNLSENLLTAFSADNQTQKEESQELTYEQIDLSIPLEVYNTEQSIDLVWDLMRVEAQREAEREPLLVSFLFSTILNHPTLESALAFHLANRLSSPTMISTQIQSLIMEALDPSVYSQRNINISEEERQSLLEESYTFRTSLRADILAVRDRDPACTCLPDVFLYFKGFHALQTYRVSHFLWKSHRQVLAHYLQSQVSQVFQIDIHPNANLGSGLMLDHGTGIVIGETSIVGHNCSILHHVTLGGSGKKGVDRHPKIGNGVLIGAGASVLGNIQIGNGVQIGAGTLVLTDLPDHCVAVGVPAKIIGIFKDVENQPSLDMNQTLIVGEDSEDVIRFGGSGI